MEDDEPVELCLSHEYLLRVKYDFDAKRTISSDWINREKKMIAIMYDYFDLENFHPEIKDPRFRCLARKTSLLLHKMHSELSNAFFDVERYRELITSLITIEQIVLPIEMEKEVNDMLDELSF